MELLKYVAHKLSTSNTHVPFKKPAFLHSHADISGVLEPF